MKSTSISNTCDNNSINGTTTAADSTTANTENQNNNNNINNNGVNDNKNNTNNIINNNNNKIISNNNFNNHNHSHHGSFATNNVNLQKSIEVYEQLKTNEDAYWKTVDGLNNEQKIDIFVRILRKETPENRSEYQIRFLSQQCMQLEFFQNLCQNYGDQVVNDCVRYLRYEDLSNDQILFEQGERGTRFYIILQGSVHILIKLPERGNINKFKSQRINTIHAGKAFGEVALMNENTMRTATIKSGEFCRFAYLEKDDFKRIIGKEATEQINQRYQFIKDYNFFDEFTYRELITFSYHFNETQYKRGEIVYDIFDSKIDEIYFVKEGSFMLQGSFDITQQYIPNFKVKRQHKTFNIEPLVERTIFGLEYFNKNQVQNMHGFIKHLEEMSSSNNQSKHETPNGSNNINFNDNSNNDKFIPFSPYRIGRVICDSTRGSVYRVKGNELEQRLWKEDSKYKFHALSSATFTKQVEKIQLFIQKSLEEKSNLELLREQAKYLKPPIEYLGKKEQLKHLYDSENNTSNNTNNQSQNNLNKKSSQQLNKIDSFQIQNQQQLSSSPSLLRNNGGSPMNNHISLLMDMDKFFKSSIEFAISDKSPFHQSIQKIKLQHQQLSSPLLSPKKINHNQSIIHPCLIQNSQKSFDNSPRKQLKNVTISDFNKIDYYLGNSLFNLHTKKHSNNLQLQQPGINKGESTLNHLDQKNNGSSNNKTFSLCVFHADDNNGQSSKNRKQTTTSRHVIHEEESVQGDFNYGSSVILNKKLSPRRLYMKKSDSGISFNSELELLDHSSRMQLLKSCQELDLENDDEDDDPKKALQKQKKELKQCSPQRRSPDIQSIHDQLQIQKSEKKLRKDFIKNYNKILKDNIINSKNNSDSKNNKNQTQINQQIKSATPQSAKKTQPHAQLIPPPKDANEMLNKVFYFAHNRNELIKREVELQQFKKQFLGEDPEETNPSNVIRGNTESGLNEYDQDLLKATTLDDYKRRKYQRKLQEEQDTKFQKLFSNDLVDLGKANENSEYNNKVKLLYRKNRKENKIIFDKTAQIVKQQNFSYNQVREYFYKQDHKDRFFQDIFLKNNSNTNSIINQSRISSTKNNNNYQKNLSQTQSSQKQQFLTEQDESYPYQHQFQQLQTMPSQEMQQEQIINQSIQQTPNNTNNAMKNELEQQQSTPNSRQYSSATPKRNKSKRQSKLILKDKRGSSYSNTQSDHHRNSTNPTPIQVDEQVLDKQQIANEIEQLQARPDYLSYLLQKNQSMKIQFTQKQNQRQQQQQQQQKQYKNNQHQEQLEKPMVVIQTLNTNQNEQDYYINTALKLHKATQIESDYHKNNVILNKQRRYNTEGNNDDENEYSYYYYQDQSLLQHQQQQRQPTIINNNEDDKRITTLQHTEGSTILNQNHLTHLKYTPTTKSISKINNSHNNNQSFKQNQLQFSSTLKGGRFLETNPPLSQTTTTIKYSQQLSQNSQQLQQQSQYSSQSKSPTIMRPTQFSITFTNTNKKQEINTEEKNTFLSQNHRKYIVNSRIQQRDLFLKSKSSIKRYSTSASTHSTNTTTNQSYSNANSNLLLFPSQIDVNSKCLAQIPSWNLRSNTSQGMRSQKKSQNNNFLQPRSLQIVSVNKNNNSQQSQMDQSQLSQQQYSQNENIHSALSNDNNNQNKRKTRLTSDVDSVGQKLYTDYLGDTYTSVQKENLSQNQSYIL